MMPKHFSALLSGGNEITRIFHIPGGDVLVAIHAPISGSLEVTLNGLLEKTIADAPGVFWFAKKGPKK
jgi:hypothetical protein